MDHLDSLEGNTYTPISYSHAVQNDCGIGRSENINSRFFKNESGYMTCSEYAISLKPEDNTVHAEKYDRTTSCKQSNITEIPNGQMKRNYSCHGCNSTCSRNNLIPSENSENNTFKKTARDLNNRCLTGLIVVLVLFILVFTCSLIALFVKVSRVQTNLDDERLDRKRQSNIFCLPCNDLILGPMEEDNDNLELLMIKNENGVEKCCAKGANQTSLLVELLFQRREKLDHAQDIIDSESSLCKCNSTGEGNGIQGNSVRIAGHFLSGVQSSTNNHYGKHPHTVHNWTETGPVAHSNGIKLQDSIIAINTSGLYFIYSQILFTNLYTGQSKTETSQALYHYVYRWNVIYPNDGNELLLKSVRTQCWAENRVYGDYTSYTAGYFKLNVGDQLYVKVSKTDLISRDPISSFFGIVRL